MKISYKNTLINYTDSGKGNTIVLLHGFLENSNMWNFCLESLSKKHRIITLDLLGHGQTDCLGYVHTMEEMATVVHFVLQKLRIRKVSLIGHSMGGYVALAFAELYPNFIKKVLLLNSTSKADDAERKLNRERAIEAVKQNKNTFTQLAIANLFSPDNRERLQTEIEKVRIEALQTPIQGVIAAIEGMKIRKDREFLLQENRFPVTLVAGKKDPVLNLESLNQQTTHEGVTLIWLPDGHMSHLENQEEILEIIHQFCK